LTENLNKHEQVLALQKTQAAARQRGKNISVSIAKRTGLNRNKKCINDETVERK